MHKKVCFLISLNFAISAAFSFPDNLMVSSRRIVADIVNCNFLDAFNTCDSLKKAFPQDPLPSLLKLTAMGMRDIDLEWTVDSTGFLAEFENTQTLIGNFRRKHGESSYIVMLDGFSKAMHAAFYLRKKAYFDVLHNGADAIKLLKDAKELDSANTDADFFLGLYDYGKAELKKSSGGRFSGIREVNLTESVN
jgi:hypothetical protein